MASCESRVSRRYDKENLLWQSTVAIRSDPVGSNKDPVGSNKYINKTLTLSDGLLNAGDMGEDLRELNRRGGK